MHATISEYLIKARQGDAARAGQRDRMLVEARRIRVAGRRPAGPAGGRSRWQLLRFVRAVIAD
jgi:hypothetical protein